MQPAQAIAQKPGVMKKISETESDITITASKHDILKLSILMNWLIDEHNYMDKVKANMREEDIEPAILKWEQFISKECLGFAEGYDIEP